MAAEAERPPLARSQAVSDAAAAGVPLSELREVSFCGAIEMSGAVDLKLTAQPRLCTALSSRRQL